MNCSKCGKNYVSGQKFCSGCGSSLEEKVLNEKGKEEQVKAKKEKGAASSNKKKRDKKMVFFAAVSGIIISSAVFVYFNYFSISNQNDPSVEANADAKETDSDSDSSDPTEGSLETDPEIFFGYWANEKYILQLTDSTFTYSSNDLSESGVVEFNEIFVQQDVLYGGIPETQLSEWHIEISDEQTYHLKFQISEDGDTLESDFLEGKSSGSYTRIEGDKAEEKLLIVLDYLQSHPTSGKAQLSPEEDYTIEDFTGYWFPFDVYGTTEDYQLGRYGYYFDGQIGILAYFESEGYIDYIHSYDIEGNTLTMREEYLDYENLYAVQEGFVDEIEREITESQMTLFKEENSRDRLIIHTAGLVLQKVEPEELLNTPLRQDYNETYYPFAEDQWGETIINEYNALSSNQYYFTERKAETASHLQINNYPYSLGELSEFTLFEEQKIIEGKLSHPESPIDNELATAQLLDRSYESTPSYGRIVHQDAGYYFTDYSDGTDTVGSVTLGSGGRTQWGSTPGFIEIVSIDFKDHIYTIRYSDNGFSADQERFYRINEDVIYAEDSNGDFTLRYEHGTDWEMFQGLPSREEGER